MAHLAELLLGLLALLEAEGRTLQENILALVRRLSFLFLGLCCIGAALVFFICAIYKALNLMLPPVASLLAMALICLVIAYCLMLVASKWKKPAKMKQAASKME